MEAPRAALIARDAGAIGAPPADAMDRRHEKAPRGVAAGGFFVRPRRAGGRHAARSPHAHCGAPQLSQVRMRCSSEELSPPPGGMFPPWMRLEIDDDSLFTVL